MQSSQLLFALVAALTLSGPVNGGWLQASSTNSWQDYCSPNGVWRAQPHVCFESEADVNSVIPPNASFSGYVSSTDPKKFVILSTKEGVSIETKTMSLKIQTQSGGCVKIDFSTKNENTGPGGWSIDNHTTQCPSTGFDVVSLPAFLGNGGGAM